MEIPINPWKGICTVCWENSTEDSKYNDVCDECLPLTIEIEEGEASDDNQR